MPPPRSLLGFPLLVLWVLLVAEMPSHQAGGSDAAVGLYEDTRCKCVCPRIAELVGNGGGGAASSAGSRHHRVWVATLPSDECTCERALVASGAAAAASVVASLAVKSGLRLEQYCLRCECRSESRNTAVQKVVVLSLLFVIGALCLHMIVTLGWPSLWAWLRRLPPMSRFAAVKLDNQSADEEASTAASNGDGQQRDGEGGAGWSGVRIRGAAGSATSAVVTRARATQASWSRSVAVQRDRVYRHRSMLN